MEFLETLALSILLYAWTIWTLIKCMEKKLHRNYTLMLHAVLSKSCKQHPTKKAAVQPLTSHLKNELGKMSRHVRHCQRNKDELISNVLVWTLTHGCATVGLPAKTYLYQLYVNTGYGLVNLTGVIEYMGRYRETDSKICVLSTTW